MRAKSTGISYLLAAVLTGLLAAPTAVEAAANALARLTVEDLADAEGLTSVALSPDGNQFAIVRNEQIELVSSDGGWPTVLTSAPGGKQGVKWSPDGQAIAFVSQGAIWTVPVTGGQPKRLTEGRRGPGDPRTAADRDPQWSPDGKWILFVTGQRGHADLSVVSADGLTTTILTDSPGDQDDAAWSADGTRIAYVRRTPDDFSGSVVIADFDSSTGRFRSDPRTLYTAPQDRGGGWSIRRPEWSPDGKSLALVLQITGWNKIFLEPVTGGTPRQITTGEGEDDDPVFSPDGHFLAFVSNREKPEERHIWVVAPDGSAPRLIADPRTGVDTDPIWSPGGAEIYYLHSSSFEPDGLSVASVGGGKARELIHAQPVNFANTGVQPPEVVHYKSGDGLSIAAILYRPLHYISGKRYPAVLWIHGGPEAQDTLGWDPWALYLAQNGYFVLTPNYRGSTGYGERFRNLNVEDSGGGEVIDVAQGAAYLVAQGYADQGRIGIGGGSHGGTMVAYEVTKEPDVFHAAIEMYGVVDRAVFIDRTNRPSAIRWMMKMGGTPAEKPEVYRKADIIQDVPRISAPLLILHGEDDPQVPPFESEIFTAALKAAGKPYLYFTYPHELHGFSQRDHRLDAWRKEIAFLNYYLQPRYGRSVTSTSEIFLDDASVK
jgi:dipeptidyl aminopeptidase/acylaminoacyl peptidase